MKKIYFLASALLAVTTLKAQTTVDFEDLPLAKVDTFYNGSDEAGGFTSGGITFGNKYTTGGGYWSGFSYSNMRNDSTPGYLNQYSAYPANGADASEKYAIYTDGDTLFLPGTNANVLSVELTNTTYAYLSMKNGDGYSKKFGSVNGANDLPDGTEGKDFFYVRIYGHDVNDNLVDSVDYYLADFRSEVSADHYIIDEWKSVDLSALTGVNYLTFEFYSSDMSPNGPWLNTPAYFAMDNFVYTNTTGVIQEQKSYFTMYPNPANSQLNIKGDAGLYVIYNIHGKSVIEFQHNNISQVNVSALNNGVYFVKNTSLSSAEVRKLIIK